MPRQRFMQSLPWRRRASALRDDDDTVNSNNDGAAAFLAPPPAARQYQQQRRRRRRAHSLDADDTIFMYNDDNDDDDDANSISSYDNEPDDDDDDDDDQPLVLAAGAARTFIPGAANAAGLHQRHLAMRRSTSNGEESVASPPHHHHHHRAARANSNHSHSKRHHHHGSWVHAQQRRPWRWRWRQQYQWRGGHNIIQIPMSSAMAGLCGGAGLLLLVYLVSMLRLVLWQNQTISMTPLLLYNLDQRQHLARVLQREQLQADRCNATAMVAARWRQRQQRTTVPTAVVGGGGDGRRRADFSLLVAPATPRVKIHFSLSSITAAATAPLASVEQLCGYAAQSARLQSNRWYARTHTLGATAHVLLTAGAVSPLGILATLVLQDTCHARIVTGVDVLFPNDLTHRLATLEPLSLLSTHIYYGKGMGGALNLAHIGSDPIKNPLPAADDMDWVASLSATHVLHLGLLGTNWTDPWTAALASKAFGWYAHRHRDTSLEQILASLAAASSVVRQNDDSGQRPSRPHLVYVYQDEREAVLAQSYYAHHGVPSVGLRVDPHAIVGPWMLRPSLDEWWQHEALARNDGVVPVLAAHDVVQAIVAALQLAPAQAITIDLMANAPAALTVAAAADIMTCNSTTTFPWNTAKKASSASSVSRDYWTWQPQQSATEALVRARAWQLDHDRPYGSAEVTGNSTTPNNNHGGGGARLLEQYNLTACAIDDVPCHARRAVLPCASECSDETFCAPSLLDDLRPLLHDVSEDCDVVLYTQALDVTVTDLKLQAEFMEEGDPLICNFALLAREAPLTRAVLLKVPDAELVRLDIKPLPGDAPGAMHERKLDKLNGRLLYRGWILIWPTVPTPSPLSAMDKALFKISPGRLLAPTVKFAMSIDADFPVTPTADDITFLVHDMHRPAWPKRMMKDKNKKIKYRVPPEPARQAVLLVSQLKLEDSVEYEPLPPDSKISLREATRFMRFEKGELELRRTEPFDIRQQREFYERLSTLLNHADVSRHPDAGQYKFNFGNYWPRTKWVLHDLRHGGDAGRQLRCQWLEEHLTWQTPLDQLSLSFVLAKLDVQRRILLHELEDNVINHLTASHQLLVWKQMTDAFEWLALPVPQNAAWADVLQQHYRIQQVPYNRGEDEMEAWIDERPNGASTPLFVRVLSDKVMAQARKMWTAAMARAKRPKES